MAVGGVSITVLTLVLSFDPYHFDPYQKPDPDISEALIKTGKSALMFLVAALIVATVSGFVGAHMMAETAAFFTDFEKKKDETKRPLGQRLFVLATTNIFIAIALVLFSIYCLRRQH